VVRCAVREANLLRSVRRRLGCKIVEEGTDAERSKAVYVKRRFRCAWLPDLAAAKALVEAGIDITKLEIWAIVHARKHGNGEVPHW